MSKIIFNSEVVTRKNKGDMTVNDWATFYAVIKEGLSKDIPEQQEKASPVKIWENVLAEGT